jgi:hypothetical protein
LFAEKAPVCVMMREILTNVLSAERLDAVFESAAQKQYTRELTFSSLVSLLTEVVTRSRPSPRKAYQSRKEQLQVSAKAVYEKINHTEPATSAALVATTASGMQQVIAALGTELPSLLPGYRVKILDGNHFSSTHRRLKILRGQGACLPGQVLAVLDPQSQLIEGIVPCVDGHAQERSLVESFLKLVAPNDVWIEDRNFCTTKLIFGIAQQQAFFIVRQHSQSLRWRPVGEFSAEVAMANGTVAEQEIIVENESGEKLSIRRVRIALTHATRDGDRELYLLTNLPAGVLAAAIAQVYRGRWQIETAFQEATVDLLCEVPALGHPQAAILVFAVAALCFNAFSVLKAALRTQLPIDSNRSEMASLSQSDIALPAPSTAPATIRVTRRELGDELSTYHLAENVAGTWQGLNLLLPDEFWKKRFENLPPIELACTLRNLAQRVPLAEFCKRPTKTQRSPTRKPPKPGGHVATARLMNPDIHRN